MRGKISVFLLLALVPTMALSEIYHWIDENGNAVYSDKPRKGATTIKLPGITTYKAIKPATSTSSAKKPEVKAAQYTSFAIRSPQDDQTIRSNSGRLQVAFALQPSLRPDHSIVVSVGNKQYTTRSTRLVLENVDRGTHTISASVRDRSGRSLTRVHSIKVHILRHSILFKKKKSSTTP